MALFGDLANRESRHTPYSSINSFPQITNVPESFDSTEAGRFISDHKTLTWEGVAHAQRLWQSYSTTRQDIPAALHCYNLALLDKFGSSWQVNGGS